MKGLSRMKHKKSKKSAKVNILPHTQAKLDLYKYYLDRYLVILEQAQFISKINIFDTFCGTGIYENGKFGSPILTFHSIAKNRNIFKSKNKEFTPISLTINDGKPENVINVAKYLNSLNQKQEVCELNFQTLESTEMFQYVNERIKCQQYNERNLVFIDPYGYKEINRGNLLKLLETKRTEVILFLPISFMYRFKTIAVKDFNNPKFVKLREFINGFFDSTHPVSKGLDIDIFDFIRYIEESLTFSGRFYSASYYIQRDTANYFALFFITHHILGQQKILEEIWKLDETEGQGFHLPKGQLNFIDILEREQKQEDRVKSLETLLTKLLSQRQSTNNVELYDVVLRNRFLPKHANEILRNLQEGERLIVWDIEKNKLARNGSFYLNYGYFRKNKVKVTFKLEQG